MQAGRVVVCPDMRHPAKFLPPFLYSGGPEDNGCHKICFPSQLPLYEQIMEKAPSSLHTLIASGDVYIRAGQPLQTIPDADVVCYGLWVDPNLAKNHGVFVSSRVTPDKLDFMLQKPSVEELGKLMQTHLFLMDIGIWLLSDRAVSLLVKRSYKEGKLSYYDMYSDFGLTLGEHPRMMDDELNKLSVAILPLPGGEVLSLRNQS